MRRAMQLLSMCLLLAAQSSAIHAQSAEDDRAEPGGEADSQTETAASFSRAQSQEQALHRHLPADQLRQLESGDDAFLGLFLPAGRLEPQGGILLIADRDEHADWPQLIGPARRHLSRTGWHTLAIALPDLPPADPAMDEAARTELMAEAAERITRRINVAAQALRAEGADQLVLLGRGEGAYWALHATASMTRPKVEAAALILVQARPPTHAKGGPERIDALLAQRKNPILEIFVGAGDATREQAKQRQLNAQRHANSQYQHILLPQQDQSELGQQMLVKRFQGWLTKALAAQP